MAASILPASDPVTAKLLASRKELLDLSLRNPLLNYRGSARRGVEIVGEDAGQVFVWLVEQARPMRFHATRPSTRATTAPAEAEPGAGDPATRRSRRGSRASLMPDQEDGPTAEPAEGQPDGRDNSLATPYPREVLDTRLLATWADAWLGLQERGCNTLYLALGMLRWREAPDAEEDRFAPLVLVPVRLERRSARSAWSLALGDEDPGPNVSLMEKLRELAIRAPEPAALETGADLDAYLAQWAEAVAGQAGWAVERGRIGLGFFSFARFLMWRDLDPAQWPPHLAPGEHRLLRGLFADGFREAARSETITDLDRQRPPGAAMELLDCDSSQAIAIARAAQGCNLVIHGPPGTGKSQTIANLLADAVARGQRVLFVAEKLAALEVVKRRLDQVGLGALCLELHSDKANKKTVIEDLRSTLQLGRPLPVGEEAEVAALPGYRDQLNGYALACSTAVAPTDLTPVQAVGEIERLRATTAACPSLPAAPWAALDPARFRLHRDAVTTLARHIAELGCPSAHAFHGCVPTALQPGEEAAIAEAIAAAGAATAALVAGAAGLAALLGIPAGATGDEIRGHLAIAVQASAAPDLGGVPAVGAGWDAPAAVAEVPRILAAGATWSATRQAWAGTLREAAWTIDVRSARADIALAGGSWWSRLFSGRYRAARRLLATVAQTPPISDPVRLLAACDAILAVQEASTVLERGRPLMESLLGPRWQGGATAWPVAEAIASWAAGWWRTTGAQPCAEALARWVVGPWDRLRVEEQTRLVRGQLDACQAAWVHLGGLLGHPCAEAAVLGKEGLTGLAERARCWADGLPSLPAWAAYCQPSQALRAAGFHDLAEHAHRGSIPADRLVAVCERAWALVALERAQTERPALRSFEAHAHAQVLERFRAADQAVFAVNRTRLALRHWEALPGEAGFGQVGVLRRECAKKSRHLPLRQLMAQAGQAVQAAKPIFMMSPLSVAAFLPPGTVAFDLVIFDEASQVRPVDALGAILRARQVVVVGDEQQMPPTSFFDRLVEGDAGSDEDDAVASETADMQSVLGLCLGKGMHQEMLRWHYRSRHDSLIALSNREFYRNELVVFPSPRRAGADQGLVLTHLSATAYERGASRTNPLEADAVVAAAVEHLRAHPQRSLGVVAFSVAQRSAIEDRVERLCRSDPAVEALLKEARPDEPFFVKNLENVQGDERDAIFISVGYGKDAAGHLTMNFGPLGQQGGERRLNVLITRARVCCRVFTNLRHEDLDLRRAGGRGIAVFRQFLQFAASGSLEPSAPAAAGPEAPFEQAVAAALRCRGHAVEAEVGCSGYRIDLAVADPSAPGAFLLGIECDGAQYHGARWARDRDRLREAVLTSLGWRIHRIWSADWYRRRDDALRRLEQAIADARAGTAPPSIPLRLPAVVRRDPQQQPAARAPIAAYRPARLTADLGDQHLAEVDSAALGRALAAVVAVESPMHLEDLRRRVLEAIEGRPGSRRLAAIDGGVAAAERQRRLRREGDFLWRAKEHAVAPRDRSDLPEPARAPHLVHAREWQAAVLAVVREGCGCASREEAAGQAVLALGVKRNDDAAAAAALAVGALIDAGSLVEGANGMVGLPAA
jgi:very-short-patch-repair endonuclease